MKTRLLILTICFSVSMISCGDNGANQSSGGATINTDVIKNTKTKDPNAKGGNTCLLSFQEKMDELFTREDALAATGFSEDKMEVDYKKVLGPQYQELRYLFRNQRMAMIPYLKQKAVVPDVVTVRGIGAMSFNQFDQSYRAATEEDFAAAKEVINAAADGESIDPQLDGEMKKAKQSGMEKEAIKKGGNELLDAFKNASKSFVDVEGLGDAARWNEGTNELTVISNGVKFQVFVDVSEDTHANKVVAQKVAQTILSKCK